MSVWLATAPLSAPSALPPALGAAAAAAAHDAAGLRHCLIIVGDPAAPAGGGGGGGGERRRAEFHAFDYVPQSADDPRALVADVAAEARERRATLAELRVRGRPRRLGAARRGALGMARSFYVAWEDGGKGGGLRVGRRDCRHFAAALAAEVLCEADGQRYASGELLQIAMRA